MIKISFDKIADAVYIRASSGKVAKTKKVHHDLIVDLDSKGKVRGVEILNASHFLASNNKAPSIEIGSKKILIPA